ncbi:MAG: TolC family protein [Myxococcales bacterium]|nr:TolC family protein [Myxococcales bacterium]
MTRNLSLLRSVPAVVCLVLVGLALEGVAAKPAPAKKKPAAVVCTLAECTDRALKFSPLMAAARADLDKYRSLLSEAKAARYPSFSATGFLAPLPEKKEGRSGSDLLNDWDWTSVSPLATAQLTFTQVLWTFGKIDALREAARAGVNVGKSVTQVAKMEMRYQVARAWWGLLIAKELTDIISAGTKKLDKERTRLLAEQEAAEEEDKEYDPTALLRLRMAEADLQGRVRQARRAKLLAEDALRVTLGLSHQTPIRTKAKYIEPLEFPMLSVAAYERLAIANHPKLLAMRNGTVARFAQLRYQKTRLWPDLVLTGRLAYTYAPGVANDDDSLADNPTNPTQSGGGLALRWRLDFRQFARIDRARAEHRKADGLAQGQAQKVRLAVRNLVREMHDGKAMIAVYERAMKAARGWLSSESQMSKGGFSDYKEVVRALEQYYRRKLKWLESIYAYNIKVAEVSRAVGVDITSMQMAVKPGDRGAKPKAAENPVKSGKKSKPGAKKPADGKQKNKPKAVAPVKK